MPQAPRQLTLIDLQNATGFSSRQIRFYITEGLVSGAGERGPNATYSEDTLRRLQLIAQLKEMKVEPVGRSLTLAEIRNVLDTLGEDGAEAMLSSGAQLTIMDTDATQIVAPATSSADAVVRSSALDYVRDAVCEEMRPPWTSAPEPDTASLSFHEPVAPLADTPTPVDLGPLESVLRHLHRVLADLTSDKQIHDSERGESWRRVRTPDIEIQVRVPDDDRRRARLEEVADTLGKLLDGKV